MSLLAENFTLAELRNHIKKKLGGSVWRLEGMSDADNDLIDQAISDAMLPYSRRCPLQCWEVFNIQNNRNAYTLTNPGYGPWRVDYIEPTPLVVPLISSLLGVTPMQYLGSEVAGFIDWRRTFRRVVSSDPLWQWDENNQKIYLFNITGIAKACVYTFLPVSFEKVPLIHKDYIRRASISHAKKSLGSIRRKYDSIQGPGQNTIKLDGDPLVKEADAELEKLNAELMSFQPRAIPFFD